MRVRLVVPVVLSLLAVAVFPAPAPAAEKAIWGPLRMPDGGSAFPIYRDLGVDTLQLPLSFNAVVPTRPADPRNPADPAYRWPAEIDAAISEAGAAGIDIGLLVSGSPPWANGGRSAIHAPEPQAFADMLTAAARRYGAVRRWMIWGEPNRDDRFQPNTPEGVAGPREYSRVLDAAYGALKTVSPANIVIGGMTWTGGTVKPATFMREMVLPDGRRPRLDWFGHNPFPFRFPDIRDTVIFGGWRDIGDMDTFTRQLRRTFGRQARFWLSEFLVLSGRRSREFELYVSEAEQARWLAAAYRIADELPSIAGLGWLALLDERQAPDSSNFGLMTDGGTPKPAYRAYRAAPSERFRPAVRVRRRARLRALRQGRLAVRVRPRATGKLVVTLSTRRGRRLARSARRATSGRRVTVRLRRTAKLRRGRYRVTVTAARGASVRRSLTLH